MKVQVIIAAGGIGERMKAALPKPLLLLAGEAIVVRTLKVFEACPLVASMLLVVHEDYIMDYKKAVKAAGLNKVLCVIAGGKTRTQSVRVGLRQLDADTDMVIVHDAVRPLLTLGMIEEGIRLAVREKAAVAGVPVKPTLKVIDPVTGFIRETLDRSLIWEIQTPQVFERKLIECVYDDDTEATDDAGMVEKRGGAVKVYMGDYRNIKITTPEDILIAEAFLKERTP